MKKRSSFQHQFGRWGGKSWNNEHTHRSLLLFLMTAEAPEVSPKLSHSGARAKGEIDVSALGLERGVAHTKVRKRDNKGGRRLDNGPTESAFCRFLSISRSFASSTPSYTKKARTRKPRDGPTTVHVTFERRSERRCCGFIDGGRAGDSLKIAPITYAAAEQTNTQRRRADFLAKDNSRKFGLLKYTLVWDISRKFDIMQEQRESLQAYTKVRPINERRKFLDQPKSVMSS